jgi:hypothetical protein
MPRSPTHTAHHDLPRPSDPIRCAADALRVVAMVMHRPLEAETIAFFLDDASRSDTITIISGTTDPESVVAIAECMAMVGAQVPALCGLVLASVRPEGSGVLPGDIDRWLDAEAIAEAQGVELIEWFVISPAGTECPRELLGEPERW